MTAFVPRSPRARHVLLAALGGAAAGALVLWSFDLGQQRITFYAAFALAGAVYGLLAGFGIRMQVASFHTRRVFGLALLVAVGFVCIIGLAVLIDPVIHISISSFFLPPIAGIMFGQIARASIAESARIGTRRSGPAWGWGAAVFTPGFWVFSSLLAPVFNRIFTSYDSTVLILYGAMAGAIGGLVSSRMLSKRIEAEMQNAPWAQQTISAGEHGTLEVVPDYEAKAKAKAAPKLDLPLPETPRQWRMVGLTALVVFIGAGFWFAVLPALSSSIGQSARPVPTSTWIEDWDRSQPVRTSRELQPLAPGETAIEAGVMVYIIGERTINTAPALREYIVRAEDGRVGIANMWQLESVRLSPDQQPTRAISFP